MKKIFLLFFIFILTTTSVFAIEDTMDEEIKLDLSTLEEEKAESLDIDDESTIQQTPSQNIFKKTLSDIYNLQVERNDVTSFLLKDLTTVNFENAPLESIHFWGGYIGNFNMNFGEDKYFKYNNQVIQAGFDGKFKDDIADFRILFNMTPVTNNSRSFMQNFFSDVYIGTNKIPHHRLMLGNMYTHIGMEGGTSAYLIPFVSRSQMAKTFSPSRKLGAKLTGNWDLIEYELGGYSSDVYFHKFFPGGEFTGMVNFKPLGKTDGKWGKLVLGGGISTGRRDVSYAVTSGYAAYKYKNFTADFECSYANGYNGLYGATRTKANGYVVTLKYDLTPKIQLLARYDHFNPNRNTSAYSNEYTAGINYFLKGQAARLMVNYVFSQKSFTVDSHRIVVATQIML